MQDFARDVLSKIVNRALRYDPVTQKGLTELAGKRVTLTITDWQLSMDFVLCDNGEISVLNTTADAPANAVLEGTLSGLMKSALAKGDQQAARAAGLTIQGDVDLAQALQRLLANLDIDWEEALAEVVGDPIAHGIGSGLREMIRLGKQGLRLASNNMAQFLKADSGYLPTRSEVNHFTKQVTMIRYDVDRLAARIAQWEEDIE